MLEKCKAKLKEIKYNSAMTEFNNDSIESLKKAVEIFTGISDYRDSAEMIEKCKSRIEEFENKRAEEKRIAEERRITVQKAAKKKIITISAAIGAVAVCIVAGLLYNNIIVPANKYKHGLELIENGSYDEAVDVFGELSNYKDSNNMILEMKREILPKNIISAGYAHTVGLKADGTVVAVGENDDGQCDVSDWTDIVAVSTGDKHTVGLKADGTVVAVGENDDGQCDVSNWTDIVAVSAGRYHTVGLKADGTVVVVGENDDGQCDVSNWTDIVAVSAGSYHAVGLKADGTVVAIEDYYDQSDVSNWTDVSDWTDVSGWTDIVAVSAGWDHTVGLKADGTVVAVGDNNKGLSDWTDIVAVSAGSFHTVGLKADGTVVAVGNNDDGQCDVSGWTNIKTSRD
ncbi:MAG: RCC1 domain-containing protein [Oscillospiraceae bacterium]